MLVSLRGNYATVDREPIAKQIVRDQLLELGVRPGGVLIVHTSFHETGPVEGGPAGLIAALLQALGDGGTLVMPSMTCDDDKPFDPGQTPCLDEMGVLADTFWRQEGTLRSDSPHSFAAIGVDAETITRPHPVEVPHGHDSPVGHVLDLHGQVLLLGVGHDSNTTIHLAENLAGVRYRVPKYATVEQKGRRKRIHYGETDHCCQRFGQLDDWLGDKQATGTVGHTTARLADSRDIVDTAVEHLRQNETAFLHPFGVDSECDAARASIPAWR
jgi:aminoglycoside 3-N-acetyltransferase